GQYIDMALLDVGMAVLANQAAGYLATGKAPGRAGNIHPSLAPYQDFKTNDGNVLLAIGNDGQFARFCAAVGHPDWAADARFATNTARVQNRSDLLMLMTPLMQTRGTQEWITLLEDKAVPCGPINTVAQAFDDPQVKARGIRMELPRDTAQTGDGISHVATVASPMRLSGTPVTYRSAPPALGQHTTEVLTEMGLSADQLAQLQAQQVI
ncbi:MAG: CaiB/BaiF CoA-transferase family protein, partial [Comamonas sp.]